ncbi:crotonase/enoyl-CoA hydratase family protein [Pseudomonas sp. NPDC077186]|uniref:crotonase/enoyl-CoA hydratase family protein n=2 Tax=Pseudomonas TaxID=286 RepID=UPI0037C559B6
MLKMGAPVLDDAPVCVTRDNGILIIRLNRPAESNAVNGALARAVSAAMDELDGDPELRIGIITGSHKAFCAGMDLKAYLQNDVPATERGFAGITRKPAEKPLIAAIEGFAVAGGLEIALSCDLIVAARGAKLGVPEPKRGLVAAAGGLIRLPKRIPYQVAMYLAITGDYIDAERAYEIGLVNELCEPGQALERALLLARRVADNAPLAVQASKAIVRGALDLDEEGGWELQDRLGLPALGTEDAREGASAFAEKRQPVWKGR